MWREAIWDWVPGMDLIGHHDWFWGVLDHGPQGVLHTLFIGVALLRLLALSGLPRCVRRVITGKVLAAVAAAYMRERCENEFTVP